MTQEYRIPDFIVHEIGEVKTLSETAPGFLTSRGDWRKLKQITGNGKGIRVGVGDTGVDKSHLEGDLVNVIESRDFTRSRFGFYDRNGHGSHVTCHIGAAADESGIEGIASDCEMMHAKILGDSGSGTSDGIARGIDWLVENGCKIINLSLGGGFSSEIDLACKRANEAGVLVFAALGNDGTRGDGHPGNSRYTFGVAAVDYNKRLARFSSRSRQAMYAGYGVNVLSCWLDGRYSRISGTSMACPDQAGIAALVCSYCELLGDPIKNMRDYFERTKPFFEDLGPDGWDVGNGYGFFDIWKFIEANPIEDSPADPPVDPPTEPPAEEPPMQPPVDPPTECEDLGTLLGTLELFGEQITIHSKPIE